MLGGLGGYIYASLVFLLICTLAHGDVVDHSLMHKDENHCPKAKDGNCKFLLHTLRDRKNFGEAMEERGFTVAAELGVQTGFFSDMYLYTSPSTTKYILVDTWAHRSNYSDAANVDNSRQEQIYQGMLKRLGPYRSAGAGKAGTELQVMRMWTTDAAPKVQDESIDFIYVDARHDYCGVKEDIEAWWPKLKVGGIMAGDDYLTAAEQLHLKGDVYDANDDWGICYDGSRHEGAVKAAVKKFASKHGLAVYSTWKHDMTSREKAAWPQWIYSPKRSSSSAGTGTGTGTGTGMGTGTSTKHLTRV